MKFVMLNYMDVPQIQQNVLLLNHVKNIIMNKLVYMLKVIMENVFIKIKHVKLYLAKTYLMVILMRLA